MNPVPPMNRILREEPRLESGRGTAANPLGKADIAAVPAAATFRKSRLVVTLVPQVGETFAFAPEAGGNPIGTQLLFA
jgi:hypothetical protein